VKYVYKIEDTKDALILGAASERGTSGQPSGSQTRQSAHSLRVFPFPSKD
jgi:hypothetical protein